MVSCTVLFWGLYNIVLLVGCVMDVVMFELFRGGVQLVFLFFGFSGLGFIVRILRVGPLRV